MHHGWRAQDGRIIIRSCSAETGISEPYQTLRGAQTHGGRAISYLGPALPSMPAHFISGGEDGRLLLWQIAPPAGTVTDAGAAPV